MKYVKYIVVIVIATLVLGYFGTSTSQTQSENKKRAEEIVAEIAALKEVNTITSKAGLEAYENKLASIETIIDSESISVQHFISNKDRIEQLYDDLYTFKKEHIKKVDCNYCHGDGGSKCDYCNGRGECLVTWYEHGDWGETSYTTYDCTRCNGSGRIECGYCHGGVIEIFE